MIVVVGVHYSIWRTPRNLHLLNYGPTLQCTARQSSSVGVNKKNLDTSKSIGARSWEENLAYYDRLLKFNLALDLTTPVGLLFLGQCCWILDSSVRLGIIIIFTYSQSETMKN